MEKLIKENPNYKLLSKAKLYQIAKDHDIPKTEVDDYLDSKEVYQVFKTKPRKTKLKITAPPYSFQIDIVILPKYKISNAGITKFLLLIDILSRKIFAYPLKTATMDNVIDKYLKFLEDVDEPVNSIAGDDFFNSKKFQEVNDKLYIQVYTDVAKNDHLIKGGGDKLGILDRSVRTIKSLITKYILEHKTTKWTSFLQDVVDLYNDTPNSGIGNKTPNELFDDYDYALSLHENQKKYNEKEFKKTKIQIGNTVRVALGRGTFEKEKQKFSSEIYKVASIQGYRFILQDEEGKELKRKYRADELLVVKRVEERKDGSLEKEESKTHKKATKLSKELGIGHDKSLEKIRRKKVPKKSNVSNPSDKVDLFDD